jgi:ribonuclease BN (tRNA processing enzyme)
MQLTILGSGGWIPARGRETCAALLAGDGQALLLDAGTGIRHLVEHPELLDDCSRLDIVLSHFHLDHTCGLSYLPAIEPPLETCIWGPGSWLYAETTAEILARVFTPPQSAVALAELGEVRDVDPGGQHIGPFTLRFRSQLRHPDPTIGIGIDNGYCYCTDTGYDPGSAAFASEAAVLLHDAWSTDAEPAETHRHATAREAARVAAEAAVSRLILIHLNPRFVDCTPLLDEARRVFPATELAEDLSALSADSAAS